MDVYPHLHTHSFYTLLGATPSPEALAQRAASEGMSHLALTDTNALYGAVAFDRACRAAGVHPILGLEVTVQWPPDLAPGHGDPAGTLTLLARDQEGYRSLCRLSSLIQGFADREQRAARGLSLQALHQHAAGLICLTGGWRGYAYRCLAAGHETLAHRFLGKLCGVYNPDRLYVALEPQPQARQGPEGKRDATAELSAKATFLGLRTVAVQPVYTLDPGNDLRLRLLAAIDHNCRLGEVPPSTLPTRGDPGVSVHWLSPTEMVDRFADYADALANIQRIAEQCGPALPDGTLQWPTLDLPEGASPEATLKTRATRGAEVKYGAPLSPDVQQRLERELTTITEHGYAPLFLVVADIVRHAREKAIPVSTRGSVANSLVAYTLRITNVDPIAHGLLFERFLSPGRADPPDIDLDFCSRRRDEVLAYIRETYGADRVALVGAMSTLRLRSAARETAKAYDLTDKQLQQLLSAMPRRFYGPRYHEPRSREEVLSDLTDPWLREAAEAAYSIEDFPHHLSIHAAGLIITPGPLTDLIPVQMAPKGYLTTQFDHGDCEAVGLPKLDLLGIRALTVLADTAEEVTRRAPSFRLDEIPLSDAKTADLLARGDTVGVFQCDSVGARRTLRKLKARSVQDLAIANAFFKPGPAMGGQADVFVRRYRGEAPADYLHPALEPILAPTKGVLIFQEQVLRVATEIAGLSWAQADHIRRGMSKMRPGEMRDLEAAFIAGCQRPGGPGLSSQQAEQLWTQVSAFSGYGFNQGHATAYADVSYRSAYMKAHHPAEFFWARLRNYGGYHHPAIYMAEAIGLGIDIRPPHVNHSVGTILLTWEREGAVNGTGTTSADAKPPPPGPEDLEEHAVLWLGLGLIRDLRRSAIAALVRARRSGPFADLRDLLVRVPLQPKEIVHLIQAGALDGLGANRPTLLLEAETALRAGTARQMAFDFAAGYAVPASPAQRLAWERHLIGFPLGALRAWLPLLRSELARRHPGTTPVAVRDLTAARGTTTVLAVRLPGWHRGGYGIWDGESWIWTETAQGAKAPPVWEPVVFRGHWRSDRWGVGSYAVQAWEPAA